MRFSWRGWALLIVSVATLSTGFVMGRQELLYAGYFGVSLPLFALVFARVAQLRLGVTRTYSPPVVAVGHPTTATLDIGNIGRYSTVAVTWRDQLPWAPFFTGHQVLPPLPPRTTSFSRPAAIRVRYELLPQRRGIYDVGPLLVELSDPFGLVLSEIAVGETHSLVVVPDVVPLPGGNLSTTSADGSARVMQLRPLGGEDDLMTRNYRTGDALRRVHWRASAHHGELMVRQEEQRTHTEARLVIDTQRAGYSDWSSKSWWDDSRRDEPESAMFEEAVRLTASLAMHLRREGFILHIVETASHSLAPADSADEFLESLAAINLSVAPPTRAQLAALARGPDAGRSRGAIFAILADATDDTLDRLIALRPDFDQAIAFLLSSEAGSTREHLEASGWICISVSPGEPLGGLLQSLEPELEVGRDIR
ncbi:MAG: hypothetical protein JWO01_934 [Microbacteriaceae bacterium]|jgi:uncharacterized protein (DUF58 family)|nr:hypothetical protein [Microbacteriaceae bacterium]